MNFTVNVIVVCNSGLSTAVLLKQRLHMIVPELNVISTCRVSDVIKEAENINPDIVIVRRGLNHLVKIGFRSVRTALLQLHGSF